MRLLLPALALLPSLLPACAAVPPGGRFAAPRLFGTDFASGPDGGVWQVAIADFDGDGLGDVAAAHREAPGSLHVLFAGREGKCAPAGEVARDFGGATELRVRAAADGEELLLLRADGSACAIARAADGSFAARELAAGEFAAAAAAPRVPERLPEDATAALARGGCAVAGELTGDGVRDLLVLRRDADWRVGRDLLLFAGARRGAADADQDGATDAEERACGSDPRDGDSDDDGLLDGWELHGVGGVDLPGLGASPLRQDVVVYLQCLGGVDEAAARAEIERAVATWAGLPVENCDGSRGIALHALWLPAPGDEALAKPWWQNAAEQMPRAAKGVAHYMQIGPGGGGQAAELGDAGGCGANALWATFLHEFGHQVGLSHAGGDLPGTCPTYTSLMNYAYSYGFAGAYENIHYSTGPLAGLALDETRLPERIERPHGELSFLGQPPFAFRVEPDGAATRVDWNRDGRFAAESVRADVTDVYGADGGVRHLAGKTVVGPALAEADGALWVFFVDRERRLQARRALDRAGAFGDPVFLSQLEPSGDLWAQAEDGALALFVPTAAEVAVLRAATAAALAAAAPERIPDSAGAQVSAFAHGGRLHALLWDGPDRPLRWSAEDGAGGWSAPQPFADLRSLMPPAAVADPAGGDPILGWGASAEGGARSWRVARAHMDEAGVWTLAEEREVGAGSGWHGNSRPVLLVEHEAGHPAPGRLHFIARGFVEPADNPGCWYEAIEIGDAAQAGGWRLRRFYDEWTQTRSPVAAAFHGGDLALAYRWYGNVHGDEDDNLHVAFEGFGVRAATMRDFDDVGAISRIGLARSIPWRDPSAR